MKLEREYTRGARNHFEYEKIAGIGETIVKVENGEIHTTHSRQYKSCVAP